MKPSTNHFIKKRERRNIALDSVGFNYHTIKVIIETEEVYVLYMQSLATP